MEITSKKPSSGFPCTPMHRLTKLKLLILGNGRDFCLVARGNSCRIFSSADQYPLLQMWLGTRHSEAGLGTPVFTVTPVCC